MRSRCALGPCARDRRPEDGTATLAVITFVGVVLVVALGAAAVLGAAVAHRRAQAAADLAALAGAAGLQQGDEPCALAARIAADNGALLDSCRREGDDVAVTVTVALPVDLRVVRAVGARARAGPS